MSLIDETLKNAHILNTLFSASQKNPHRKKLSHPQPTQNKEGDNVQPLQQVQTISRDTFLTFQERYFHYKTVRENIVPQRKIFWQSYMDQPPYNVLL